MYTFVCGIKLELNLIAKICYIQRIVFITIHITYAYIAHHHMHKMSYTMQHVCTKPDQHAHTHKILTHKTHAKHTHMHTLFQTCMQSSDPSYICMLFYALILILAGVRVYISSIRYP